jgi:5'-methylthioadenosine phosphorylase
MPAMCHHLVRRLRVRVTAAWSLTQSRGNHLIELAIIASQDVETKTWLDNSREIQLPAGDTTVTATMGSLHGRELIVLPRNSSGRPVPPHALDYRANIEALARAGVRRVLSTAMVGSLRRSIPMGSMLILDQFIDFTRDRQSTYFTGGQFGHADMTEPYCPTLRRHMIECAEAIGVTVAPRGCYVCVPGPRFETRAEVRAFAQLGGDVVGFTNVTDCVMAREAGLCFATFAGVVNLGAGLSDHEMKSEDWRDARKMHADRFAQIVAHMAQLPTVDGPDGWASCRCAEAAPIEK